jgi:hypothetical protein
MVNAVKATGFKSEQVRSRPRAGEGASRRGTALDGTHEPAECGTRL